MNNPITVGTTIKVSVENVWELWNTPEDIIQRNNPSKNWQTLKVENDLKDGGKFFIQDGNKRRE